MLRTPPLAVEQTKREIMGMSELAMENFDRALGIITTLDFKERELFNKVEEKINFINRTLVDFVVRLSNGSCTPMTGTLYLELSSDSERIADHLINVAKTIRSLKR